MLEFAFSKEFEGMKLHFPYHFIIIVCKVTKYLTIYQIISPKREGYSEMYPSQ